jgi:outer membrane protein assembly factor BamB
MYALNVNTGHVDWKFKTDGPILSSPAIADDGVYFTSEESMSGALYKLDANTGNQLWRQEIPYEYQFTGGTEMIGSPSIANGMVFVSSDLRTYFGIDANTGVKIWAFRDPDAMEFIVSSPIHVDGQLYIIDKFNIASLNATNGNTNWSFFTGDELYASPSYADGKIYVMTSQRHIYILDAYNNGSKLASYTTPSGSWSSPTIANERLYIGNHDWNIYCFANTITNSVVVQQENVLTSPTYIAIVIVFLTAIVILIILVISFTRRLKKGDKPSRTFKWPSLKER